MRALAPSALGAALLACDATPAFVSPSPGSTQTSPWITVYARVPTAVLGGEVALRLDDEALPQAQPLVRPRRRHGRGADLLATLALDGLSPGSHTLTAEMTGPDGTTATVQSTFSWRPAPCALTLRVEAEDGAPLWARAVVLDAGGQPLDLAGPDAAAADPRGRDAALHHVFVRDGEALLHLPALPLRVQVLRDLRHDAPTAEVDCSRGGDVAARVVVREVLDLPGWSTADLHVHTARSGDAFVPDAVREWSLRASGLDYAVLSDHNRIADASAMGLVGGAGPALLSGIESRVPSASRAGTSGGHLNAFPVSEGPEPVSTDLPLAEQVDGWRARQRQAPHGGTQEQVVLQMNHPRGIGFVYDEGDYRPVQDALTDLAYDRERPLAAQLEAPVLRPTAQGTTALDVDAIELMNRFSWPLYLEVRRDWFALLNDGQRITATGNSDSHAVQREPLGAPLNLVACPPGADDSTCLVDAIQKGRVLVSTGPVVEVEVTSGEDRAGPGETLRVAAGAPLTATAIVQAAPWVPAPQLRWVVDGEVVERQPIAASSRGADGTLRLRTSRTWTPTADGWLVVEAGWPLDPDARRLTREQVGDYAVLAPDFVPVGFTNAVRIDADGEPGWTAPGLRPP